QAPQYPQGPVVHLRADNPKAQLQQLQLRWRTICSVPCGLPTDPAGYYRVGGNTIRPSAPFRLPRQSGEVLVDAQVASHVRHWMGLGVGIGGIIAAVYGGLYIAFGQTIASSDTGNPDSMKVGNAISGVGIGFLIAGAVLGAVGITLWSTHTSVEVH